MSSCWPWRFKQDWISSDKLTASRNTVGLVFAIPTERRNCPTFRWRWSRKGHCARHLQNRPFQHSHESPVESGQVLAGQLVGGLELGLKTSVLGFYCCRKGRLSSSSLTSWEVVRDRWKVGASLVRGRGKKAGGGRKSARSNCKASKQLRNESESF